MHNIFSWIIKIIATPFVFFFSPLFYWVAKTGNGVSICRRMGFQPLLVHYYEPVPDYESVPVDYFHTRQTFPGFEIVTRTVTATLHKISAYAGECRWPENKSEEGVYFAQNGSFGYSSAAILYSMIRSFKSKRVIEVGSGYSSLIILDALKKNHPQGDFNFTCIEPYPLGWLKEVTSRHPDKMGLRAERAETVDENVYLTLKENDIFFIDSSHVSKLNSDVNFLYLHVLPRMAKGVIVHIHDIYIPYEYPKVHFYGIHKIFWNEQYLVQAFLTNNKDFEIIMPGYFVQTDMNKDFQTAFPYYDPLKHRSTSSFWLRKIT
jgi:methyltransferase family protein